MRVIKFLVTGIVVVSAFSVAVMLLWNWLIPVIFGLAVINFWQALGLLLLARILFGGFGPGKPGHAAFGRHQNAIREKWINMSPEERNEFIRQRREFGFRGPFGKGCFSGDRGFGDCRNEEVKKENE